jgi:hypothetical protein
MLGEEPACEDLAAVPWTTNEDDDDDDRRDGGDGEGDTSPSG